MSCTVLLDPGPYKPQGDLGGGGITVPVAASMQGLGQDIAMPHHFNEARLVNCRILLHGAIMATSNLSSASYGSQLYTHHR
jgi:hypothetical protein